MLTLSKGLIFATVLFVPFYASSFTLSKWSGLCWSAKFDSSPRAPLVALFASRNNENNKDDDDLQSDIDSFLRGEYDRPFAEDAAAPHPGLSPRATIEAALSSLRDLNKPFPAHGAAVLQRFCAPLSRGERWGGGPSSQVDPWKEVLRGAITPTMLAKRLRASIFSVLLDWTKLDVTDGCSMQKDLIGVPSIAFVNAALFFGDGLEPCIVQFTLRRFGGVWLIDSARVSKKELFVQQSNETNWKNG